MQNHVDTLTGKHEQVIGVVVPRVVADVMHDLARMQRAPDLPFGNGAVLVVPFACLRVDSSVVPAHYLSPLGGVSLRSATYSVDRATPSIFATSVTCCLGSWSSCLAMATCLSVSLRGRPPLRPRALAAARPAMVRSRMSSRSNSASAPKM